MNKWLARMAAVVLAASMALTACSGNETGRSGGTNGDQGADEGSVTLKDNEGKDVVVSSKQEIPDSFPKDVPIPDSLKIVSSISSDDSTTLAIETDMPFDEAVALYDGYVQEAGYVESFKMDEEDFYNYSGRRGQEQFVVTLQLDLEDNKTVTGVLVYSKDEGAEASSS